MTVTAPPAIFARAAARPSQPPAEPDDFAVVAELLEIIFQRLDLLEGRGIAGAAPSKNISIIRDSSGRIAGIQASLSSIVEPRR